MRLLAIVVVMGCGLPGAQPTGSGCTDEVPECFSDTRVSICEGGKWADYACPSRCSNNQPKVCDWSQAKVGEACPASFDGVGGVACNADGTALIGCRSGKWAEVRCPYCRPGGGGFLCG